MTNWLRGEMQRERASEGRKGGRGGGFFQDSAWGFLKIVR